MATADSCCAGSKPAAGRSGNRASDVFGGHGSIATEILGPEQCQIGRFDGSVHVGGHRIGDTDRDGDVLARRGAEPDVPLGRFDRRPVVRPRPSSPVAGCRTPRPRTDTPRRRSELGRTASMPMIRRTSSPFWCPKLVIDRLEVIDVDHDDGGLAGQPSAFAEVAVEPSSVSEPGQTVAPGHRRQLVVHWAPPRGAGECCRSELPAAPALRRRAVQMLVRRSCHRFPSSSSVSW